MPPLTSQTSQTNYDINQSKMTNALWIELMVDYWSNQWANGTQYGVDRKVPEGWVSATFGEPDANDRNGIASAQTQLAFLRYFQNYQPGKDKSIDQMMPWIAPGPDDFVETAAAALTRIEAERWKKAWDEGVRQFDATLALEGRQLDEITKQRIQDGLVSALDAYLSRYTAELSRYATEAELFDAQETRKNVVYNIQSGTYNANESNRSSNLQQAGSLASALQQAYDARTENAIKLHADPGNFIEREYAVRALNAPPSTGVPAYKNVDALEEVIRKLIDYVPNKAPDAPVPTATVGLPTAPTPPNIDDIIRQLTNGTGGGAAGSAPGQTPTWQVASGQQAPKQTPGQAVAGQQASYAYGGRGVRDRQFITGDPQDNGRPNPEFVQIHNPGPRTTASVTPLQNVVRRFAYGTDEPSESDLLLKSYPDEAYQNYPSLKYLQGRQDKQTYNTLSTGSSQGAFGAQLPESGAINYGKYLNVAKDPLSLALLASSYRSSSRDIFSEVARAKARAPFGQAVQTSLVRT